MRAYPSFFISVLAQGPSDGVGESSIEYAIPESRGDAIAFVDPAGTVMVQVVFLQAPEQGKSGIREMQGVVQPLFRDVALHNAGEHHGRGVNGKQKAGWGRNEKERQNVLQFAANVAAIKGALVMIP